MDVDLALLGEVGISHLPGIYVEMACTEDDFLRFHIKNPEVYEGLRTIALGHVARGRTRLSFRMCWEVLRDQRMQLDRDDSGYSLNNNYCRFYSRMLSEREPELRGVFEQRDPAQCTDVTRTLDDTEIEAFEAELFASLG